MYRGPAGTGVSTERIETDWQANPPPRLWRTPLTNGLSSVAVSGGRVFTQVRRGSTEYCVALDAVTGRFLWTTNVGLASYPDGGVGSDDGPRSTPAVRNGRVYVLGTYLNLRCLDAATGTNLWSKDLRSEFNTDVIPWQNAASPLLEGDLLLLNCNAASGGALVALQQADGKVAWRRHNERMTHATPVPATIQDERQVVFLTQSGLVAVRPADGIERWRYTPIPYSTSIAATPIVESNTVFYAGAYSMGASAARIERTDVGLNVRQLWPRRSSRMIHWSSPVVLGGYVYGLFGSLSGELRCLDLRNGDYTWQGPQFGLGAILLVDGRLLIATEDGQMVLAEANPVEYRELARFTAVEGRIWNSPALSDGVLYVRGTTELAAYDLAPPAPPALRLTATAESGGTQVVFVVANADGTPIAAARASRIRLVESPTALASPDTWTDSAIALTLRAGQLEGVAEPGVASASRFVRAREE